MEWSDVHNVVDIMADYIDYGMLLKWNDSTSLLVLVI